MLLLTPVEQAMGLGWGLPPLQAPSAAGLVQDWLAGCLVSANLMREPRDTRPTA